MPSDSNEKLVDDSATNEIAAREAKEKAEKDAKDRATCDNYVRKGLNRNVTIQFLIERLTSMGCPPPPGFIRCVDCGDKQAGGGFGVVEEIEIIKPKESQNSIEPKEQNEKKSNPGRQCIQSQEEINALFANMKDGKSKLRLLPDIFLCQQHLQNQTHAHEAIVHELIHAVDLCRTKMDCLNNCIHLACTEIRAENLSGECHWLREIQKARLGNFVGHGAECVKRRAVLSVKANPKCTQKAEEYVDAAFERCYKDTFPFDRHPNLR